jgi:hypothetical protein
MLIKDNSWKYDTSELMAIRRFLFRKRERVASINTEWDPRLYTQNSIPLETILRNAWLKQK